MYTPGCIYIFNLGLLEIKPLLLTQVTSFETTLQIGTGGY